VRNQSQSVDEELETLDRTVGMSPLVAGGNRTLSIIVLGASGDLAKKKTFPALWGLYREGLLPPEARIVGYARSKLSAAEFEKHVTQYIKVGDNAALQEKLRAFTALCSYVACTTYESEESMAALADYLTAHVEGSAPSLPLPPSHTPPPFPSPCRGWR